mmetsp:Transcript_10110/g.31901  ORF Transcript_10110/g.31901 Transcript_10110/m.31901 type:complete len:242 (+) Transcript_10110:382-1107(+)
MEAVPLCILPNDAPRPASHRGPPPPSSGPCHLLHLGWHERAQLACQPGLGAPVPLLARHVCASGGSAPAGSQLSRSASLWRVSVPCRPPPALRSRHAARVRVEGSSAPGQERTLCRRPRVGWGGGRDGREGVVGGADSGRAHRSRRLCHRRARVARVASSRPVADAPRADALARPPPTAACDADAVGREQVERTQRQRQRQCELRRCGPHTGTRRDTQPPPAVGARDSVGRPQWAARARGS